MTQADKMQIIAGAMEEKHKIEIEEDGNWIPLNYDKDRYHFILNNHKAYAPMYNISELLMHEIRIAKQIPLLSDADADFAEKYLPKDWFLARNIDSEMYIFSMKPVKGMTSFCWTSNFYETQSYWLNLLPTYPTFSGVKWEDEDCFTVQELLDYYRESKVKIT